MRNIDINYSFANQKITGQQRYATEITRAITELIEAENLNLKLIPISPSRFRAVEWISSLFLASRSRPNAWLITLTSRGPLHSKKHAVVVHDLFPFTHGDHYGKLYTWTHKITLQTQLKYARLVICVSEPVRQQVIEMRLTNAPTVVAPNAPSEVFKNFKSQSHASETFLANAGLTPKEFFLSVGSHEPRKNLQMLIDAHLLLSEPERARFPLVIVGSSFPVFKSVDLGRDRNIILLRDLTDYELAIVYANALAVIMPSLAEGFGLPAVEAMACGADLILNDIEIFHWVVGENAVYVDCSNQPKDLSDAMQAKILDADLEISKKDQPDRFSWATSAKTIVDAMFD